MAKQVKWTSGIYNSFCKWGMLSEDESFILETRIKGWGVTKQAQALNKSESSVHKMIAVLKKKYDAVQKEHPDELPPRRFSAKETWMDEN